MKKINLFQKFNFYFFIFFSINFAQLSYPDYKPYQLSSTSKFLIQCGACASFPSVIIFLLFYYYKIKKKRSDVSEGKNDSSIDNKDCLQNPIDFDNSDNINFNLIESLPNEIFQEILFLLFKEYVDCAEEKKYDPGFLEALGSKINYKFRKLKEPIYYNYEKMYHNLFWVNTYFRKTLIYTAHKNSFFPGMTKIIHHDLYNFEDIGKFFPIYATYYCSKNISKVMKKEFLYRQKAYEIKIEMMKFIKDRNLIPLYPSIKEPAVNELYEFCKDKGEIGQRARTYKEYRSLINGFYPDSDIYGFYPDSDIYGFYPDSDILSQNKLIYGNTFFIKVLIKLYTKCIKQYDDTNSIKIKTLKKLLLGSIFYLTGIENFLGIQFLMLLQKCFFQQYKEPYDGAICNIFLLYLADLCKKYNLTEDSPVIIGLKNDIATLLLFANEKNVVLKECYFQDHNSLLVKAYFANLPFRIDCAINQFNVNGCLNFNDSYNNLGQNQALNYSQKNTEFFFAVMEDCNIKLPKVIILPKTILTLNLFQLIKKSCITIKEIIVCDVDVTMYDTYNVPKDKQKCASLCIDNTRIVKVFDKNTIKLFAQKDTECIAEQVLALKKISLNPVLGKSLDNIISNTMTCQDVSWLKAHIFFFNKKYVLKFKELLDQAGIFTKLNSLEEDLLFSYSGLALENLPTALFHFCQSRLNFLDKCRKKFNNHVQNVKQNYSFIRKKIYNSFLNDRQRLKHWMELLIKDLDHINNMHTINYQTKKEDMPLLKDVQNDLCGHIPKLYNILKKEIQFYNDQNNNLNIFCNLAGTIIVFYSSPCPSNAFQYCGGKPGFDYIVSSMKKYALDHLQTKYCDNFKESLKLTNKIEYIKNKKEFFLTDFIEAISWQPA